MRSVLEETIKYKTKCIIFHVQIGIGTLPMELNRTHGYLEIRHTILNKIYSHSISSWFDLPLK